MSAAVTRVAVVPGVLALEPRYASLVDPVAELRAAVEAARAWAAEGDRGGEVVVLNGSARRTESSPGPFDERAVGFDEVVLAALTAGDPDGLKAVDVDLGRELWASLEELPRLVELLVGRPWAVTIDYDAAPYGVAWWVVRYAGG